MFRRLARLAALTVFTLLCSMAAAQPYPARPIRLVVTFPPGGGTDLVARHFAVRLATLLGQPIVVENVPGAGGKIGVESFVRTAKPDGYTLLLANSITHNTLPLTNEKLAFDTTTSFTPIGLLASYCLTLVASTSIGVNSLQDLIAQARSQPGKLTYGSAGTGSGTHLIFEAFKKQTGVDILHVPYKGSAPATQAAMAGETSLSLDGNVGPALASGRVVPLAVLASRRDPRWPQVPTLLEAGVPLVDLETWNGLVAPAGTPDAIVQVLNTAIQTALREPAFVKSLNDYGMVADGGPPAKLMERMRSQAVVLAKVADIARMAPAAR